MSADVGDLIQSEETADHSNQEELIQIEKTEIELHFCSIRIYSESGFGQIVFNKIG